MSSNAKTKPDGEPPPPDVTKSENKNVVEIPKFLFWGTAIFTVLLSVIAGTAILYYRRTREIPDIIQHSIGSEGVQLFLQYDRNDDGFLSIEEFEPLILSFIGNGINVSTDQVTYNKPIEDGDELVTVKSYFEPLLISTMTKDKDPSLYFTGTGIDSLVGLGKWKKVNIEWMNFGVQHFSPFLPEPNSYIDKLGDVYQILEYKDWGIFSGQGSSNRFYPPKVEEKYWTLHRLLTMFHPRPFLVSRFAPQGSIACVRAYNREFMDIVFRIHAEYQLSEPPFHPFWFTPAQFTGNLIISRDYKHILYFHLYVPTDKKLNVDMEWLTGEGENGGMEVDIGFMPQMELNITAPSIPVHADEPFVKDFEVKPDFQLENRIRNIKWEKEITETEAFRNLEVKFYPFKQMTYHNFTDVFHIAKAENKLVHSILLWGALDDQSC